MNPFGDHLLNVITYLPAVGAVAMLLLLRGGDEKQGGLAARVATGIAGVDFLLSLLLWFGWDAAPKDAAGFRFVQEGSWIDAIGARGTDQQPG